MPTWPATLPQDAAVDGFSHSPQANKVSFQPDVGPSIDRRRATAKVKLLNITLPPVTAGQVAIFDAFFENDLKDGVLPFDWKDPITGAAASMKFGSGEQPYTIAPASSKLFRISFQAQILP